MRDFGQYHLCDSMEYLGGKFDFLLSEDTVLFLIAYAIFVC